MLYRDEIETLVEAAVSTNDHNERLALYAQINDFVSEHSIVWPLFSREGVVAIEPMLMDLKYLQPECTCSKIS